jgi:putative ABC transport system ATP-binding protein
MAVCEVERVRKVYGSGAGEVAALDDVSVSFEAGAFAALAGPSGSGKTTLLNLIGGLDVPSSGVVRVDGRDTGGLDGRALARLRAEKIGFIFQSFNLIPVLTAAENVAMALQLSGRRWPDAEARVRAMLEAVGLGNLGDRLPTQLSGGQQQRVAIARALVKEPALVIADEPTANLDSHTGAAVLELMRGMNRARGVTLIVSTHDPMVIQHVDRVVRLRDGRVVSDEVQAPQGGAA